MRKFFSGLFIAGLLISPLGADFSWGDDTTSSRSDSDRYKSGDAVSGDQAGTSGSIESETVTESESDTSGDLPGISGDTSAEVESDVSVGDDQAGVSGMGGETSGELSGTGDEAGTAGATVGQEAEITRGALNDEVIGVKPQAGIIVYRDLDQDDTSRLAVGLTIDMNALTAFDIAGGRESQWYLGPQTGLIFSHVGATTSNFFGTDPDTNAAGNPGANVLIIPANLKIGYAFSDNLRVSARGGGNVVYRSVASSLQLGSSSAQGNNDVWRIFPNVGGDLEIGFGQTASLIIRPDVTITPDNDVFTGTVGLGIALG